MPDMQALLDQLDQLDQQATPGPWEYDGSTIDSMTTFDEVVTTEVNCSMYCYGGTGIGVQDDKDAEFITLARTALPQLAKALRVVLDMHQPTEHQRAYGFPRADKWEHYCTADNQSWPCPTVQAITDVLGDDDA